MAILPWILSLSGPALVGVALALYVSLRGGPQELMPPRAERRAGVIVLAPPSRRSGRHARRRTR